MKTKYFVLIILSLFIYKLSANEYINNFYVRDIFLGQTTLISEDFIVHGIKYEVECKGEIKIIKGYYFNSTKLKFIDTYLNNKLVNTEYFSKYEKKIFERKYKYDSEGRIIFVETLAINENTKLNYTSKNYFEYCGEKIKVNCFTNYSLNKQSKIENYYCIWSLVLNKMYKPLLANSEILISSDKKSEFFKVSEKWKYKKAGYNYKCDVNNKRKCFYSFSSDKGLSIKKEFFEDKKKFYKESIEIFENKIIEKKIYNNNIQENIGICNFYSDSFKEILYNDIKYIHLQDEKIIFKNGNIRTDNLSIPLDIFGFRYFAMDYTLYE